MPGVRRWLAHEGRVHQSYSSSATTRSTAARARQLAHRVDEHLGEAWLGHRDEHIEALVRPGLVPQLLLDDQDHVTALPLRLPEEVHALEVAGEATMARPANGEVGMIGRGGRVVRRGGRRTGAHDSRDGSASD